VVTAAQPCADAYVHCPKITIVVLPVFYYWIERRAAAVPDPVLVLEEGP